MRQYIIAVVIAAMSCTMTAYAQTDRTSVLSVAEHNGWEYEVKAGVNIGGASPLPMPVEIREISSYSPKFNGTLEGTVTKWLGKEQKWGVSAGLKFEEKGMITGANVKNYSMEILNDGSRVAGYWTGYVKTASYDFSSNLRHFQWGGQLGATWRAFNHFTVNADLTWAFNNIFESDFKTISFGLYPIYLNLGFGYRF